MFQLNEEKLETLLTEATKFGKKPAAVEALWDGDTTGWFIRLYVVLEDLGSIQKYESKCLTIFSYGGDIRIFNSQVPPWPEAEVAGKLGDKLANILHVPFFFPSPNEPDDDCPHWWEQEKAVPCKHCQKLVLVDRTKGICYNCELRRQR